jgi:conjugal transfer pilus assembly protein TraU
MKKLLAIAVLSLSLYAPQAKALCAKRDLLGAKMLTQTCFACMLPVHFAGVPIAPGMPARKDSVQPFYVCPTLIPPKFGFSVGFYDPVFSIEVVKDPYCFPSLGVGKDGDSSLLESGTQGEATGDKQAFYHAHVMMTPILEILGIFEAICPSTKAATDAFDILDFSEVIPQWSDEALSAIMYPETALFANPALMLSCMADGTSAQISTSIDSMFWCKGAWGGTYPLTGNTLSKSSLEDAASVGAGFIAFSHRNLLMWRTWGGDTGRMCAGLAPHPFWDKSAYRMQLMYPNVHPKASQIGEAGIISQWSSMKWEPWTGDNFSFLLFRKLDCIMGL